MKKTLFISFIPVESSESAAIRNRNLIVGLDKLGYAVDVITPRSKGRYLFGTDVTMIYLNNEWPASSESAGKDSVTTKGKTILKGIYHKVSIYGSTLKYLKYVDLNALPAKKYDFVISSSDPVTSHLAVPKLKRQGLVFDKWIQYWGDPYMGDITRQNVYPEAFLKYIERSLQKDADKIVYVSPFTLENQKKLYPKYASRYCFLPIAYSGTEMYSGYINGPLKIGYFGAYKSEVRNILPLYQACKKMEQQVELYIVGNSDLKLESCSNVRCFHRMEPDELRHYEDLCDVFVCLLNLKGNQLPGKLYHCAGTNKPILVIVDGDNKEEIIKYLDGFHRFILANNDEASICRVLNDPELKQPAKPCTLLSPESIAADFLS